MQNQKDSLSQKIKDNLFYVALFVGLVAILAVVVVYTKGQNGEQLANTDSESNQLSEYARVDEDLFEKKDETEKHVVDDAKTGISTEVWGAVDLEDDGLVEPHNDDLATQDVTEEPKENSTSEKQEKKKESVPVIADAGELNFNSESTIAWPVNGSVILPFSMETTVYFKTLDQYRCNPGMLIQAGNGSTVKSAYLGKVTKVTSDNTYGNMVTMYLGNDYSVVYGQLDTIYVKEGDFVKAGESVGTIGNPTDSFADEGSHLFFQMYQGDEPVDPVLFME
ncbi:MAG: M23 family metallopeptidase [Eubacteriales bacterium]|nr:M23 family metallopeptidase [Eubacteriales bacterium]